MMVTVTASYGLANRLLMSGYPGRWTSGGICVRNAVCNATQRGPGLTPPCGELRVGGARRDTATGSSAVLKPGMLTWRGSARSTASGFGAGIQPCS